MYDVTAGEQSRRGKLKVFLGYAPGVGKTCAMLQAAQRRKDEGVDVVVAAIEKRGSLEANLEVISPRRVEQQGGSYVEMDVDAVLRRHPQLVLVDELAHVNLPGMRHARRYQDVEELLSAGIDVYATLNVQHLESLCDIVAQITGVTIHETLPDRLLDQADEIELIDLSPEALLCRFQEGRVHMPEWMASTVPPATRFFRLGNLIALRELAMRRAARWVDERMRSYMQSRAIAGPWAATERLLACVSADPSGEQVVRATHRLADRLNAEWFALHVETIRDARAHARASEAQQDRLARTLRLAEELGGRVISLPGASVVDASLSYAHAHNITRIVVGRSPRNWRIDCNRWQNLVGNSVAERLVRRARSIDVHVVGETAQELFPGDSPERLSLRPWRNYVLSLTLVAAASLLGALVQPYISPANLAMIYMLCVVVAAIYLGRGPAIVASITGVLALDFLFIPPGFTLAVADTEYVLTFLGLLGVGLVISSLAAQVRNQVENTQRREVETATLYALSRDLSAAEGLDSIVRAIVDNVGQTFDRQVSVLLSASGSGADDLEAHHSSADFARDRSQAEVATWVFRHGRPAGRGTETFSESQAYCLPLKTARGTIGVLGVQPMRAGRLLSPEQRRLLEALANQAALAIERAQLAEAAQQAQLLAATERLQSALLNSISHELRTPLVSITGVLSSLEDEEAPLEPQTRRALIETAREEAERLNRLVGNLLNMTRIEAGAVRIAWELEDVQDVIGSALEQLKSRIEGRQIRVDVPSDLPFVPMDFVLMVQVLVNVIDNALKYSLPERPIDIRAWLMGEEVAVQVADQGIGIPPEDLDRVFDKFYRVQRPDNVTGTGLGLSISKGLVEAHGGRIWAENRSGGGAAFTLTLPAERADG